ncbi:MAG: ATP-binding protein [Methanospirillum sp.]|uniref:histidine kinase N-terminal 7TM domain-containing protein n=1 Tax=Methanospirillum sp. TaxID=45200 RepID=UPI002375CE97|nr:histidine kinase N-terminal 7TM domain-containing protein [Methanospirillum sp.]MDD1730412.1 ATP-binding protein [Methanospirillum sp.]
MFISAILSGLISVITWNRRNVRGSGTFSFCMFLIAWWSFFYALEITALDPSLHILFLKIEYLAIPWIPGFVILFTLKFGGFNRLVTWKTSFIIFLIPIITFLSYFTNEFHHWYYQAVDALTINGLTILSTTPGFMYHILTAYILFSIIFCLIVFFYILKNSPRVFFVQSLIFMGILLLLLGGYLYYQFMPRLYPDFDITPIVLAFAGIIVLFEIFQYQFFDLVHFPHRKIFEHLHDGIIVLDTVNRILEINDAAITMLHLQNSSPIGEKFDTITTLLSESNSDVDSYSCSYSNSNSGINLTGCTPVHTTIHHLHEHNSYYYAIDMYPVFDSIQRLECRLIVMRDVSEILKSKNALSEAGKKMGFLTSITRHDILNQIMVVLFYIDDISHHSDTHPQTILSIEQVREAALMIKKLINFTSVYQDLGVVEPGWYKVSDMVERAWETRGVPPTVSCRIDANLVIYADMLLEKVFYNLIDNSLRHGKNISSITVTAKISDHSAVIIYEDDGGGVISEEKKKIFERGFGKNTGYGLFLVREILGITSITITETGIPGTGVRFEMTVPHGGFMIPAVS